jgi:hypothetical protein
MCALIDGMAYARTATVNHGARSNLAKVIDRLLNALGSDVFVFGRLMTCVLAFRSILELAPPP